MTLSPAELAASPTAPTVSSSLREASKHAALGPIPALCKGVYGSTESSDYAGIVGPEHTLAWGVALIAAARVIDPAVSGDWPNSTWDAWRTAEICGRAHRLVCQWAAHRPPQDLAALYVSAAAEVLDAESA